MNRFADALLIQSACNISGVARALVRAVDQVREEGGDPRKDSAVYLIVHDLGYLVGAENLGDPEYSRHYAECERRKDEAKAAA